VARQRCLPPLCRQAHPKTVPGSGTMKFQRTANSVLTVCLSPGDNPKPVHRIKSVLGDAFGEVAELSLLVVDNPLHSLVLVRGFANSGVHQIKFKLVNSQVPTGHWALRG
ncbi:MAG TPA: hypothetical protein VKV17_05455, partial [Bryobacteraceae bacterium]|nr:hypothetical protein [Bryobacteraceae bacterium]